jgi:flagellar motor switch/type III secretory pathway protein FliN
MKDGTSATLERAPATTDPPALRGSPLAALARVRLQASVELGRVRLTLGELLDLRPGTCLHVPRGGRADLVVSVQGRPLLSGAILERDGKLAVRLVTGGVE